MVTGKKNKKVFLKLMEFVIKKGNTIKEKEELEIIKPFIRFTASDSKILLKRVATELNTENEYPFSPNTLRDYAYMCNPDNLKYSDFKVSNKNLELLCLFIEETSWKRFASKYIPEIEIELKESFYQSDMNLIFQYIQNKRIELSKMIQKWEKSLREKPNPPELNFNLGICYLSNNFYQKAIFQFDYCTEIESLNAIHYVFKSLSLLNGIRPYRHKKKSIDKILQTLDYAAVLDPENSYCSDISYLIYKDFHLRIGYDIEEKSAPNTERQDSWLTFLSHCSGISSKELNIILS